MLIVEFSEGNLNFLTVTVWTKKIVSEWRPLLVFACTLRSNSIYKRPVRIARPRDVDSSVSRVKWLTARPAQGSIYSAGPCLTQIQNDRWLLRFWVKPSSNFSDIVSTGALILDRQKLIIFNFVVIYCLQLWLCGLTIGRAWRERSARNNWSSWTEGKWFVNNIITYYRSDLRDSPVSFSAVRIHDLSYIHLQKVYLLTMFYVQSVSSWVLIKHFSASWFLTALIVAIDSNFEFAFNL